MAGGLSAFVAADEPTAATDATVPAGWPFFAQFLAHDVTADRSALSSRAEIGSLRNARAARLDLECVYGRGPAEQPYLVERDDPARLLIGRTDAGRVMQPPRHHDGVSTRWCHRKLACQAAPPPLRSVGAGCAALWKPAQHLTAQAPVRTARPGGGECGRGEGHSS